jgi:hypothetical protein
MVRVRNCIAFPSYLKVSLILPDQVKNAKISTFGGTSSTEATIAMNLGNLVDVSQFRADADE